MLRLTALIGHCGAEYSDLNVAEFQSVPFAPPIICIQHLDDGHALKHHRSASRDGWDQHKMEWGFAWKHSDPVRPAKEHPDVNLH